VEHAHHECGEEQLGNATGPAWVAITSLAAADAAGSNPVGDPTGLRGADT